MKRFFTLLGLSIMAFAFKAIAQPTTCNAEFATQYINSNTVKFNPVVTIGLPAIGHTWSFGDGSPVDNTVSPTHVYNLPGTYVVVHTVRVYNNGTITCTQSFTKLVTITSPCNLVVDFNWTTVAANPLIVAFQNLSVPLSATDTITWQFGDNTTSNAVNPVHTYATAGVYTVCLTVKKANSTTAAPCIRHICKTVVIQTACNLVANFNWSASQTNPLSIQFHNLSTPLSNTDTIKWTFGDGATSNAVSPLHNYNVPGTYTVCLRISKLTPAGSAPCVREICKVLVIPPPCNMVVNFSWAATPNNPLRIEFTNLTTPVAANDSIRWTFGDGSSSNAANPVHVYTAPGTYTVCLRVTRYNTNSTTPCIRETCKTIVVTQPCNLVVDFNWTVSQTNPLVYHFNNLSTPLSPSDSTIWNFGDGTTSFAVNPVHTYTTAGTYNVCLTVKKFPFTVANPCVRHICKTIVVTPPCTLVANFNWTVNPNNPLNIQFNNLSGPIAVTDSIRWTFGDGSFSNQASPAHTYNAAGTYTVCLRIIRYNGSNIPCIREICKTIVIQHPPCTLVVNFSLQPVPGNPLRIKFTNTSTPIHPSDSLRWTFGDGTSLSGLQSDSSVANPTHNYTSAGTYVVCLRVKKNMNAPTPAGCVREKCNTIVVTPPCNFTVNYSWSLDSLNQRKVYFTNLTTPPTAGAIAVWNFGDGTSATSWNAVHEYAQPGRYNVCLRIYLGTNSNCVREKCDTVVIPHAMPPCNQLSKYTYQVFSNDNQKYKFTPDYINTTLQYTWTFGDGTGSHDPIAIHRYAQPGTYIACLTVWNGPNCASTTCKEIRVLPQINCDTAHVSYTFQHDPQIANKVYFYANATMPILDQTWTITRLSGTITTPPVILHQNNPVYTFPDTGWYRVCLRATLSGGCIKEYCSNIRIQHVTNACTLQAYPNPASATVNGNVFLTQPQIIYAYVYNSQNVLVLTKTQPGVAGNNVVSLMVNNLPAGQYTIRLVYGNSVCYATFTKL